MSVKRRGFVRLALLTLCLGWACASGPEVVLKTADGQPWTAAQVNSNPHTLLPPGAVGWLRVDSRKALQSSLGAQVVSKLAGRFSLPAGAGFNWQRDVSEATAAVYALTGADFVAVLTGQFNATTLGSATGITVRPYASHQVYSVAGAAVDLVIMTPQTALVGSRTALQGALDRIADERVVNDVPPWVSKLLSSPDASLALALDPGSSPLSAALHSGPIARYVNFAQGLVSAQALGNFEDPGLNLVGTLTFQDHARAKASANQLLAVAQMGNLYGRMVGLNQPIKKLETQAIDNNTQFALGVDQAVVVQALQALPSPPLAPTPQ